MANPKAYMFCANPTQAKEWIRRNKPTENPANYPFIDHPDKMRGLLRGFDVIVIFGTTQEHDYERSIFHMLEGRGANLIWVDVPED